LFKKLLVILRQIAPEGNARRHVLNEAKELVLGLREMLFNVVGVNMAILNEIRYFWQKVVGGS
jgi:hypothetical protein